MKKFGIISYNIYANFTNYGSALQSWALYTMVNRINKNKYSAVLVDYCPEILKDKDTLNPIKNMWDKDSFFTEMCKKSLPAIEENYYKFKNFYETKINKTKIKYDKNNFNEIINNENINGFICGSDTIFCVNEFGFDDGYYANYDCMKNGYTVSYAASFGDADFKKEDLDILKNRLNNFKFLGIRENKFIPFIKENTNVEVKKVLDPTLLICKEDLEKITSERIIKEDYILLYSRRYDKNMNLYAKKLAEKINLKIVEISLDSETENIQMYKAGVEEFLSLVKYSKYVITNSYHAFIMAVHFEKEFVIFSREQCNNKIEELLILLGLRDRLLNSGSEKINNTINYSEVKKIIEIEKIESIRFLESELNGCK